MIKRRFRIDAELAEGLVIASILLISFLLTPEQIEEWGLNCVVQRLTGVQMPTCGMTRAFISLSHLDVEKALRYNPLSPMVYSAFWFRILSLITGKLKKESLDYFIASFLILGIYGVWLNLSSVMKMLNLQPHLI